MRTNVMNINAFENAMRQRYSSRVTSIDSHTCGEATRLILNGTGEIKGATMREKRRYFMDNLDHIRRQLTREPRGHRDILAAVVTEPVTENASFGLIYMDARRYPHLCGHATIGAVTTFIDLEMIKAPSTGSGIIVDTPSGPMTCGITRQPGKQTSVTISMVPSFAYSMDQPLEVPGLGTISVDTVCVGGFFVMVDAAKAGIDLENEDRHKLTALGMDIIALANEQLTVAHPLRPEVGSIDVVEFHNGAATIPGSGIVVYGEAHMDRSPCGTGTAAKITLLHRKGELSYGEPFTNAGPLGSTFTGRIIGETLVGEIPAVMTEITGQASITGMHEFVVDPADPFPEGYLL